MGRRIMHSYDTKMRVIEMKLEGYCAKHIQKDELHRFHQPVGKQYTYGKGPEGSTPEETLRLQNNSLRQQVALLKKYAEMEKR